jgi:hypothetical protein
MPKEGSPMNIPQNWRLNKQRYGLTAVQFDNGQVAFPPRPAAANAEVEKPIAVQVVDAKVAWQKASR